VKVNVADLSSVKFWRVHDLRNLELLHATHTAHSFTRHLHDGFEIGVIERGLEKLCYRGATYLAGAGSVVVMNPGEAHSAGPANEAGWSQRVFYPTAYDVQDAASDGAGRRLAVPYFSCPVIHDKQVAGILRELHHFLETPNSALAQEAFSIWAATKLVRRYADDPCTLKAVGKEHRAVRLVREYMRAHSAENITLGQLAKIANLSPFHLVRVFTGEIGLPPHAYLTQLRLNRAKELLSHGHSIASVALETGFVDQSHLTRSFKRLLGLTPGKYASIARTYKDSALARRV